MYNGDCLEVMDTLEPNSVDLVLVDLPYGQLECEWDICIDLEKMWVQLKRICKPATQYVFFTTTKFGIQLINSNPKWFRYDLVWQKDKCIGFLNAKKMPMRSHEMMYIFNNPKSTKGVKRTYNPQKTEGKPYIRRYQNSAECYKRYNRELIKEDQLNESGDRHPGSIIKLNKKEGKLHPTQKPVDLCEWLIKTYSNEGDLVLDFCMGSGSTIVAAINTNRRYIGIEKDNEIFKVAEERVLSIKTEKK